jgi:hypothetical protein
MNRGHLSLLQNVKNFIWNGIPNTYSQIFGTSPSSASTLLLDKEQVQNSMENITAKDLEKVSRGGSK